MNCPFEIWVAKQHAAGLLEIFVAGQKDPQVLPANESLPRKIVIDVTKCPIKIPGAYATTREGWNKLRSRNAKVGVFA